MSLPRRQPSFTMKSMMIEKGVFPALLLFTPEEIQQTQTREGYDTTIFWLLSAHGGMEGSMGGFMNINFCGFSPNKELMEEAMKRALFIILCIFSSFQYSSAWQSSELAIIRKGYNDSEIAFSPSETIGGPGTFEYQGEGPHMAVVDDTENIMIISAQTRQFKGFDSQGTLLFDYSKGKPGYNSAFYDESAFSIYVDSLLRIYVQSDFGKTYVPVISYSGELLDKIRPFQQDSTAIIDAMNWAPDGTLFLFNRTYGWVTYSNGISTAGGTTGFKANNGSYFTVHKKTATSLEFIRYENPDSSGLPETKVLTELPVAVDTLVGAGLINGGDGNSLWVMLAVNDFFINQIWQFDLDYNVLDSLTLTNEEAYGDLRIPPYIRNDGNIYEFLFREDGLHVIKWTKQ